MPVKFSANYPAFFLGLFRKGVAQIFQYELFAVSCQTVDNKKKYTRQTVKQRKRQYRQEVHKWKTDVINDCFQCLIILSGLNTGAP